MGRPSMHAGATANGAVNGSGKGVEHGACLQAVDLVDVTRDNFRDQLPAIKDALKECSFCAMDLEMTGLFTDGAKDELLDDPQDRYTKCRESAANYVITQCGLACFSPSRDGTTWTAKTFNAYVFPEPAPGELPGPQVPTRRFLVDAGAFSFLAGQHFDFNKWVRQGVPYMALRQHDDHVQRANRWKGDDVRGDVAVTEERDVTFVRDLLEQVHAWLSGDEDALQLPRMNSFQRLLCWQELAKPSHFPSANGGSAPTAAGSDPSGVEGEGDAGATGPGRPQKPHLGFYVHKVYIDNWTHLRLVRATAEEAAAYEAEETARRGRLLAEASGFSEVLRAVRDSGKPVVGHNCTFDIAYILASFATGPNALPSRWADYKLLVASWFRGGVYDTKHLARQLPDLLPDTALGEVFKALTSEGPVLEAARAQAAELSAQLGRKVVIPRSVHAPGFTKYADVSAGGAAHEAGYDAFMTGAAFAVLAPLMHAAAVRAERAGIPSTAGPAPMAVDADAATAATAAVVGPATAGASTATAGSGDWDDVSDYNPLEFVARFVGRLNVSRSDAPHAALWGPDPEVDRPNVLHVWQEGATGTPYIMGVVRKLQAAGCPGRPRITLLPPAGPLSLGGLLAEVDPGCPPAEELQAAIQRADAAEAAAAAAQAAAAAATAGAPAAGGSVTGGTAPGGTVSGGTAQYVWRVQPYSAYAQAKKALLASSASLGAGPGGPTVFRPAKRMRVEGGSAGAAVAGVPPGMQPGGASTSDEDDARGPMSRVKAAVAAKCCVM